LVPWYLGTRGLRRPGRGRRGAGALRRRVGADGRQLRLHRQAGGARPGGGRLRPAGRARSVAAARALRALDLGHQGEAARAAGLALFRHLKDRRERAGLPALRLPDDPTSLLGNSSRATTEQIGAYLMKRLFAPGSCVLSDTGALLALHRREGTLRWLAARWP